MLKKWVVVGTIILGMGARWAVLQSVAWTGMVISYSQGSTFKEALRKTFDGKHLCSICKVVKAGRQSEQNQNGQKLSLKLDFFIHAAPGQILFPPPPTTLSTSLLDQYCSLREAPPTPPPLAT